MTPSSDMVEAGRRLASDLRRIRELRGVSIESIIERTKASPDVLASFEDNALVDHPMYNRVYLRSFVRTYAEALEIDPDEALQAADELLEGRYQGSLAAEYLREGAEGETGGRKADESEDVESSEEAGDSRDDVTPESGDETEPGPGADGGAGATPASGEGSADEVAAEPESLPDEGSALESATMAVPIDETHTEARPGKPEAPVSIPIPTGPQWMGRVLWAVPVIVVLALAVLLLFGRREDPEPVSVAPTEPTLVEPLPPARMDSSALMQVDMPPRIVLGDTMNIWVVAERDTLNPVRIKADEDIRRPYWVEIGDSTLVRITDRILLERETDVLALSVSGYRLALDRFAPGGPIELDREQIQAMLDSLRMVQ